MFVSLLLFQGFLWSLKSILTNHLYVMFVALTLLQISSFIGSFTYIFKFVEQQFGQSASEANFALGKADYFLVCFIDDV